ncbi:MAG TPA: YraN family protein [Acidocella sp.]|uniref:YraN family protein n=1 Tax=Acidocella sp. TaxID=50710 RepID=UPI002CCDF239|nr:YraN family protein [Acidocella sp.]HVE21473.1 YraN family protein [Acidocella sp.]
MLFSPLPPARTAKRRAAEMSGRHAEHDAAAYLAAQGFVLLAERLRTGAGEIDLVMADRDTLLFVEVKARASLAEAAYAVSPRQQARLLAAAGAAMAQHPEWARNGTRFDVMLFAGGACQHIEDAVRYQ